MFSVGPLELARIKSTTAREKFDQFITFRRDDAYCFNKVDKEGTIGSFTKLGIAFYSMEQLLASFGSDITIKFSKEVLSSILRACESQQAPVIEFNYLESSIEKQEIRILVEIKSKASLYVADIRQKMFQIIDTEPDIYGQIEGGGDIPKTEQMIVRVPSRSNLTLNNSSKSS